MGFIGLLRTLEAITRTAGHDDDRPLADDTPTPTDPGLDEECNCEPWLSDDELVAVRQLIDERFPIFAGAAASLADGSSSHPSVREDKQQEPTEPADPHKSSVETGHDIGLSWAAETFPQHTKSSASNHAGTGADPAPSPTIVQSAPPPTVDGEGPSEDCGIPASPSEGRPTSPGPRDDGILAGDRPGPERVPGPGHPDDAVAEWIGEAVQVISEVLADHAAVNMFHLYDKRCTCGVALAHMQDWRAHAAPLIANALAPQDK